MNNKEIQRRTENLEKLIKELAVDQSMFSDPKKYNDCYTKLIGIYTTKTGENFRHFYNNIFSTIAEIDGDDNASIDILGENIRLLHNYCMQKNDDRLKESVKKLYDHISLDIARIRYVKVIDRRVEDTGQSLFEQMRIAQGEFQETKIEFDGIKKDVNETSKKINNAYSEFVSILGIFSAIVLVFFGGTSVFGNIASVLSENNIYVALISILTTGLVVFDIIFMFIYFIAKLLDRNISATSEPVYWKGLISRFKDRYPIVFCVNVGIIFSLYAVGVVWSINKLIDIDAVNYIDKYLQKYGICSNSTIYIVIVLSGIYFNVSFLLAYIIAKVSDVNIGRYIYVKPTQVYTIEKDEFTASVVSNYDYGGGKLMKWKWLAYPYVFFANIFSFAYTKIFNFVKRSCCRYPYLTIVNVLLFIAFWTSLKINIYNP